MLSGTLSNASSRFPKVLFPSVCGSCHNGEVNSTNLCNCSGFSSGVDKHHSNQWVSTPSAESVVSVGVRESVISTGRRRSGQPANNRDDLPDDFGVQGSAHLDRSDRAIGERMYIKDAVVRAASRAKVSAVTEKQNIKRLRPQRRRAKRGWSLVSPIHDSEGGSSQVRMVRIPLAAHPKNIAARKVW